MTTTTEQVLTVGEVVRVVDGDYQEHYGLVTWVHGYATKEARDKVTRELYVEHPERMAELLAMPFQQPVINVVFVSTDEAKRDPYGQQIERLTSVGHKGGMTGMPRPGRYWDFV